MYVQNSPDTAHGHFWNSRIHGPSREIVAALP
jgi:hypothetical protein